MRTIQKSIIIPEDHELHMNLQLPLDLPAGEAEMLVVITSPSAPRERKGLSALAGCLSNSPTFANDPVAIQRELRNDWE